MKSIYFAAPLAALSLSACATITRGTTEAFVVETTPSGAKVTTGLGHVCEATPCTFAKVPRESEFIVTIEKEGYRTTTHNITHETAGGGGAAMAGNVLLGGIIGAAVDGNNGATQNLVPNPLVVTMEALPGTPQTTRTPVASAGGEPVS